MATCNRAQIRSSHQHGASMSISTLLFLVSLIRRLRKPPHPIQLSELSSIKHCKAEMGICSHCIGIRHNNRVPALTRKIEPHHFFSTITAVSNPPGPGRTHTIPSTPSTTPTSPPLPLLFYFFFFSSFKPSSDHT